MFYRSWSRSAEVEVVPKPKVGANCRTHPLPPSEREGGRANCFKARLNKLSLLVGAKGGRSIHRMYGFLINRHTKIHRQGVLQVVPKLSTHTEHKSKTQTIIQSLTHTTHTHNKVQMCTFPCRDAKQPLGDVSKWQARQNLGRDANTHSSNLLFCFCQYFVSGSY